MTLVPAKQKQGANFVRMNANPIRATKARPIATAVMTIAAPRIRRIATALSSRSAYYDERRTRQVIFAEIAPSDSIEHEGPREFLSQELARRMLCSVDTS